MLVVFGVLIGVISGITLMSLAVISPSLVDKKTLGDVSNVVIAVGAVFTLAFSLWQHQQTLNREKIQSRPKMRLIGTQKPDSTRLRRIRPSVAMEHNSRDSLISTIGINSPWQNEDKSLIKPSHPYPVGTFAAQSYMVMLGPCFLRIFV